MIMQRGGGTLHHGYILGDDNEKQRGYYIAAYDDYGMEKVH
jgi:hypothetical protein